jgi:hypothetical protein
MFLTAGLNLVFAVGFPQAWPVFLATFPTFSKIALFAIQFATVRAVAIRNARAEAQAQAAMQPA